MATRDEDILDNILDIRVSNNVLWMRLVEIALKHAPEMTKATLREINVNDRVISDLLQDLAQ